MFSLDPDGSRYLNPATVTQRYGRLVARLGIKSSIHKLRHYSATELIKAGVDIRTVAGRLGHGGAGATTLRVYTAWSSEADQRASLSMHSHMPARPEAVEPLQRILTSPDNPYERIAVTLYQLIAAGQIKVGDHLPPVASLAAQHKVADGTAHRAIALLKEWGVIEASRGRRATVTSRPALVATTEPADEPTLAASSAVDAPILLDLRLRRYGATVSAFSAKASPGDPDKLDQLLLSAVRRLGPAADKVETYELEVRRAGDMTLLTTFVTTS